MVRFLGSVGAIALAVLTYAGQVKSLPAMGWLPGDLTLITAGVAAACSGILFLYNRPSLTILPLLGLWWCFLFPAFMLATTPYGTQKALTLFTFTLIAAIAPFFVLRSERQRRIFLTTMVVLAAVVGVMSHQAGALESLSGSAFADINPIGISRLLGTGAVVLLVLAFAKNSKAIWRIMMFFAASGLLLMIFASGRRGPVLAVVVGVVVALAVAPVFHKYRVRALATGLVALAAASWYSIQGGSAGSERVLSFLAGEEDASTAARGQIWNEALIVAGQHPEGIGWGSFPQYADVSQMTNGDGRMYPHNLFLEGFVEGGWIIGLILFTFVVVAIYRLQKCATTPALATFLGLAGFALTNAMVSGDLNDQKLLWVVLGFAFVLKNDSQGKAGVVVPATLAAALRGTNTKAGKIPITAGTDAA